MNRFRITGEAASSLAIIAITARVFFGTVMDMPQLVCAGWLAVVIGAAIAFPMVLLACIVRAHTKKSPAERLAECPTGRAMERLLIVFAIYFAYDGAIVARGVAHSASYLSLNDASLVELLLPILLICLFCLKCGGSAIGSAARLWRWFAPCLIGVIFLLQVPQFRFEWLTPVLGPGRKTLISCSIRVAGWFTMLIPLCFLSDSAEQSDSMHPMRLYFICALLASVLMMLRRLMLPAMIGSEFDRYFFLLDTLLSNGRANISLQLPIAIVWFFGMLFTLLADAFLSAALLKRSIPGLPDGALSVIAVLLIAVFALSGWTTREIGLTAAWIAYPASGAMLIACALILQNKKEGRSSCANSHS